MKEVIFNFLAFTAFFMYYENVFFLLRYEVIKL